MTCPPYGPNWVFCHLASKLVGSLKANSDWVDQVAFYVMPFEAVWEGVAYWLTMEPLGPPNKLTREVNDQLVSNQESESLFESMWQGYQESVPT